MNSDCPLNGPLSIGVAATTPGVARVEKCVVRKMGYDFFVDMHVEVDPKMTVQRAHEIAHIVKDTVRRELPAVHDVLVHIEPAGEQSGVRSAALVAHVSKRGASATESSSSSSSSS